jgi:hypothetical protein
MRSYKHDFTAATRNEYCGGQGTFSIPCYVCRAHTRISNEMRALMADILGLNERVYVLCKQCDYDEWRIVHLRDAYEKQYTADKMNLRLQARTMSRGELCRSNTYLKEMQLVDERALCSNPVCAKKAGYGFLVRHMPLQVKCGNVGWRKTPNRVKSARSEHAARDLDMLRKISGREDISKALVTANRAVLLDDDNSTAASSSVCGSCAFDMDMLLETVREGQTTASDD